MVIEKSFQLKERAIDYDARTFEGYASTWDKDLGGDIIMRGAFTKSIKESFPAGRVKVLWNHSEPIGMPLEMREDARGLWVKGRVSKTAKGDEVLELMRDGVVDTMSIGFTIPQGKSEIKGDVRYIHEVRLMEFSPVTFAMNPQAAITGVKSLTEQIKAGGLTAAQLEELASLSAAIQALTKGEPLQSTHPVGEPLEIGALCTLFKNFGDSLGVNHV